MFYEPSEKEVNLLPLVVHGIETTEERVNRVRNSGFGTCGQISLSVSGEGRFVDPFKRSHEIKPGDIFFIAPQAPHSYKPVTRPWIVNYILFSGEMLNEILGSFNLPPGGVVSVGAEGAEEMTSLFASIDSVYRSGAASRHIIASASLYKLLSLISTSETFSSKKFKTDFDKTIPAVEYIKSHFYDCDLNSKMIAKSSGVSHPHLCRLFSSVYGMSPHDYLVQTRIEQAKQLLSEQKNRPVSQIAAAVGFSSASYFTKVFKEKTGFTPAGFRRQTTYNF